MIQTPVLKITFFVEVKIEVPHSLLVLWMSSLYKLLSVFDPVRLVNLLKCSQQLLFLLDWQSQGAPNSLDDIVLKSKGDLSVLKLFSVNIMNKSGVEPVSDQSVVLITSSTDDNAVNNQVLS